MYNNLNTHKSCLLCHSNEIMPIKGYEKYYLVKCNKCKFVFTSYIPNGSELSENYENYSRDDYLSPITLKRYNQILDYFEKFRKNNKILDIGCGIGYFLEVAKQRGWEVYGTEITDTAVGICNAKGITVFKGLISEALFEKNSFDVVSMFEVIEHVSDPADLINNIYSLLRTEGAIYVTTPNFNSINRRLQGANYTYTLIIPDHLVYFTPKTLSDLLKAQNFKKYSLQTTGINISSFLNNKAQASELISSNSINENIRIHSEKNIFLKIMKYLIDQLLSLLRIGDSIKATYIKQ